MNTKLHLKSLIGGVALGALVVLGLGAAFPSNQVGRYQVYGSGAIFVMVDTATGQAWQGDFHATINNPIPPEFSGPDAQSQFFLPKVGPNNF